MTDSGNPEPSPWEDLGPTPASPSLPAQTRTPEPRVSAETKRIIGELSLKYPAPSAISPQEHAAQLALLCRDLIDIPPHALRRAADEWSRREKWMPKASELREMVRFLAANQGGGETEGDMWARRVREGNRLLIDGRLHDRAHWELGGGGIGCSLATGPMSREAYNDAMTVDVAVFANLKRRAA